MRIRKRAVCVGDIRYTPRIIDSCTRPTGHLRARGGRTDPEMPELQESDHPVLLVQGGPQDGANIPILKATVIMGFLTDNDIVVGGPGVSRRHAEIFGTDRGYYLRDLGITNHTFVNHREIGEREYLLRDGDEIQLADSDVVHIFKRGDGVISEVALPSIFQEIFDDLPALAPPVDAPDTMSNEDLCGLESAQYQEEPEPQIAAPPEEDYEGTVRLTVESEGQIRLVVNFVTELRQNPYLRLLRLVGHPPKSVDIWLALREPVQLKELLQRMPEVSLVSVPQGHELGSTEQEQALEVQLNNILSSDVGSAPRDWKWQSGNQSFAA